MNGSLGPAHIKHWFEVLGEAEKKSYYNFVCICYIFETKIKLYAAHILVLCLNFQDTYIHTNISI